MDGLRKLYHEVGRFPSCRMNPGQRAKYKELNILYNDLSGVKVTHSVCNMPSLMVKIKHFLHAEDSKQNK